MKGWPPRFCGACGARMVSVREDGQARRRCPRCGHTFYPNPVPAVAAIISRGDRILLTLRARPPWKGTWDLPGGFLEGGEAPEQGVRREVGEELGLRTRTVRLQSVLSGDRYGAGGFPILAIVYRVTTEPGRIRPADDVAEARWFTRTTIPYRRIAFPAMRRAVRAWARARAAT